MEKKRPYRKFNFIIENYIVMSMSKKRIWKRKDHIGIENYAEMSMWKKSIWKRKDHIENLILALEIIYYEYVEKENMEKKRPYRKSNFGIENYVVMSMWKKSI